MIDPESGSVARLPAQLVELITRLKESAADARRRVNEPDAYKRRGLSQLAHYRGWADALEFAVDELTAALAAAQERPQPANDVLEWARERLANTYRIAAEKTGADRAGWLEDAAYWRAIVAELDAAARSQPSLETERLIHRLENDYDFQCEGGPLRNCTEWQQLLAAARARIIAPPAEWEGDLATEHPNRCQLRDNLQYTDIKKDDGSPYPAWRCHKRADHDGPCSSHNDCGVTIGGVTCGKLPGHSGPHANVTAMSIPAPGLAAGRPLAPQRAEVEETNDDQGSRVDVK